MKNYLLFVLSFVAISSFSQIKGTVTDAEENPLPFVTIFEQNTYNGTTSNE